ncbi:hypothetical protein ACPC54_23940 [Kitasatospora sp. NPDC094028]
MTVLALPPTSMDALRDELARVRAQLAEYVPSEPTVREEMAHVRGENDQLAAIIGHLLVNVIGTTIHTVKPRDLDAFMGLVLVDDYTADDSIHLRVIIPARGGAR